jgi:hypothetical protein
LTGELAGDYYPLNGMDKATQTKMIEDHFLFRADDDVLGDAGGYSCWDTGRGIYHNKDKTFLTWLNEEDHFRFISMQKGGNLGQVYKRLVSAIKHMETKMKFAKAPGLGYLTFCPTNLGTTLRASVHVRVPMLSKDPKVLKDICDKLFAGGDVPKKNLSKSKTEKYSIPIYANGFKDKGLYGYTDIKKVIKPSITISARGTIGYAEVREEPFFPVVRLIVLTPNEKMNLYFLYYLTHNFKFSNTGTSIPQLTIPLIENIMIPVPPIREQKILVEKIKKISLTNYKK